MTAMKKTLRLWMLLVVTLNIVSCTDLNDNPVVYGPLDEVLAANERFSDIKENPDTSAMKKKEKGELDYLSQYSMFIQQPVNHDQPDGDKFKQKVCILFRGYDRPTIMVTEGYLWRRFFDAEDIGKVLRYYVSAFVRRKSNLTLADAAKMMQESSQAYEDYYTEASKHISLDQVSAASFNSVQEELQTVINSFWKKPSH